MAGEAGADRRLDLLGRHVARRAEQVADLGQPAAAPQVGEQAVGTDGSAGSEAASEGRGGVQRRAFRGFERGELRPDLRGDLGEARRVAVGVVALPGLAIPQEGLQEAVQYVVGGGLGVSRGHT